MYIESGTLLAREGHGMSDFYEVRGDAYHDALVEVVRLVRDRSLDRDVLVAAVDKISGDARAAVVEAVR